MKKHQFGFATAASLMIIIFLVLVNYLTSWDEKWFIYPSAFILLWPMSFLLKHKTYSLVCSLMLIGLFIANNYFHSPEHPWFLYASYPIIWWPITIWCGNRAKTVAYSLIVSILTILYYFVLNIMLYPQYLWVIYPAYAILWWPISLYFAKRKNYFGLSLAGTLLSILFFTSANFISTPQTIWAIYPIFVVLWWPLSMYFFVYLRQKERIKKQK